MKKINLTLLILLTLIPIFGINAEEVSKLVCPEYAELEQFIGEFVWVAIDNSKIKLRDDKDFFPYSKNKDFYYRGYLKVVGKKGIILERGELRSEENITKEDTWIPYKNILLISKTKK